MADQNPAEKAASKSGSFIQKHKTALIILALVVGGIVIYFLFFNNAGATSTNSQLTGTTPAYTGSADVIEGPAGQRGATGRRGKQGKRGRRGPKGDSDHKKHTSASAAGVGRYASVNSGESFSEFARRNGVSQTSLASMNNGRNAHPGSRLRVR